MRDIIICLQARGNKLYPLGIRGKIVHSTLADANENRDWRIYTNFAQVLIHTAKGLYTNEKIAITKFRKHIVIPAIFYRRSIILMNNTTKTHGFPIKDCGDDNFFLELNSPEDPYLYYFK